MSPILVRPVREQLEHDRVIRLLQAKYKRKFEVAINPAHEQNAPVGSGPAPWFPDLVLQSQERSHKLLGVVEVETTESVNNLEAMSQWVTFSRLRAAFHLYVPMGSIDSTRRLCADLGVAVTELWAYQALGEQIRFTLIQKSATPEPKPVRAVAAAGQKPKTVSRSPRAAGHKEPPARSGARPNGAAAATRRAPAPASGRRKVTAKVAKPAVRRAAAKAPARKTSSGAVRPQKRR